MSFVKPQDKIVGQLLFDLGNLYALTSNVQSAMEVYDKAKDYGYGSSVLDARYAHFTWLTNKEGYLILTTLLVFLVLLAVGIRAMVKRWKRKNVSKRPNIAPVEQLN